MRSFCSLAHRWAGCRSPKRQLTRLQIAVHVGVAAVNMHRSLGGEHQETNHRRSASSLCFVSSFCPTGSTRGFGNPPVAKAVIKKEDSDGNREKTVIHHDHD